MALSDDLLEYETLQPKMDYLISDWAKHTQQVEAQRNLRDWKATSAEQMRSDGKIKPDETYMPVRVIDTNIRREQPRFLSYIVQSRRDCVFKPKGVETPDPQIDLLEQLFTDHCRYPGWEVPFIRLIDGAQTHGWDFVEVLFDTEFPGHFRIEHVGQQELLFERNCEDLQEQSFILRKQQMTKLELMRNVREQGFNLEVVNEIVSAMSSDSAQDRRDIPFEVFKVFIKAPIGAEQDVVHVAWYAAKAKTGWLREPKPFYNGRDRKVVEQVATPPGLVGLMAPPKPVVTYEQLIEKQYPFFLLQYTIGEDHRITTTLGQVRLHEADQDAASALLTCFVNQAVRASNVYASVEETDGATPVQLDIKLEHGKIYNKKIAFWNTPAPDGTLLRGLEVVRGKNSDETASVDYAAMNRQDSRKTAKEITSAEQAKAEMGAVQVTLLAITYQQIRQYCWRLFQNRVLQGKINVADTLIERFFVDKHGEAREYHVFPAGDTDVVRRQERLNMLMQLWPILGQTALAQSLIEDIVRCALPDAYDRYKGVLAQSAQARGLVQTLAQLVQHLATGPDGKPVPAVAGQEQQLQQVAAQVQQYLANPAAT